MRPVHFLFMSANISIARRPHGAPTSEMSEDSRKILEEDLKLSREAAQCSINKEMREIARAEKEDDRWERVARYFEEQKDLSQSKKEYYERKIQIEEVEAAARIASQMKISLQEALTVLRRSRAFGEDE